jgi:hypothetical protein
VTFSTSNGTAVGGAACVAGSGVDYVSVAGQTVNFAANALQAKVTVQLCGDTLSEANETVNLLLTNAVGASIGSPGTAVLTINDTASQYRSTTPIDFTLGTTTVPYPSIINVANGPVQIGAMRVTLYDLYHSLPDNIDLLLISPTGRNIILMGDSGGANAIPAGNPVTLTFSDAANQVLPDSQPLTTGQFEPTTWEANQSSFPATGSNPPPAGPYNQPGSTVGGTGNQTLNGVFGLSNSNGDWKLYGRDDDGQLVAIVGSIAGGWGIEFLRSTAAGVSISGRVLTAEGQGIRNATISVTGNSLMTPLTVQTGSFGYYTFEGLRAGETYVVTVASQRYTFTAPSRVISLVDNVTDADFVAVQIDAQEH